jgi:putative thioredoxin
MSADTFADPVKSGTDQSFRTDVLEESMTQPVIVDFWAPWCGPCRTLQPAIERVVRGAKGAVKLVKINIDENPAIAGQLGVQSIPAVFAFDQGRPVDGFMGNIPESQVKMFIDRLSKPGAKDLQADEAMAMAEESMSLGDIGGAAQGYAAVLQMDPENVKAIAGLARCYLVSGEPDQARGTLTMVPEGKETDPDVLSVKAALELSDEASGTREPQELSQLVKANPRDLDIRFELARAQIGRGDLMNGVEQLLEVTTQNREWNDQAARKLLLKVFDAAGPTAEVTTYGRRRLSSLLFS